MVINMLTAEYEQAYISSFAKVLTVLNSKYETHVKIINMNDNESIKDINYEIELKSINEVKIQNYLSVCFQKENGSLTVIASNGIDDDIIKEVVKDVSLALNDEPLASYNFKDLKDFIIYHFVYVKENVIIDNKKILEDYKNLGQIENLSYEVKVNPIIY